MSDFMKNMVRDTVRANGVDINVWAGGSGPAVLLLHGYPETGQMWRKVVPYLIKKYSLVCPDLRGYGDSGKPKSGYDKKTMAKDMAELMENMGYQSYAVVGHDRGGRVAHRLALDYSHLVNQITVLDILPTHTVFRETDKDLAAGYWHWFFFQVPDLPEIMIGNSVEPFLRSMLGAWGAASHAIDEAMFQEYLRAMKLPGTIRATLEDYRAAATIDLIDDESDANQKIECPLLTIWGEFGLMHKLFNVVELWQEKAIDVQGFPLPCGHFIPEEAAEQLAEKLLLFLEGKKLN